MARWITVHNRSRRVQVLTHVRWCDSLYCRTRGLTFRRNLPADAGLLLVERKDSRLNASIHMWAVFFSLGIVWVNSHQEIVDCCLAEPWKVYFPEKPARYILEGNPSILDYVAVGEYLEFTDEAAD